MSKGEKKKVSLLKAFANNFYLLKLSYKACKSRIIWEFVNRGISHFEWLFATVILMEHLINGLESAVPFNEILGLLVVSLVVFVIADTTAYYAYRIALPVGNQRIYEKLHLMMFKKVLDVELECYENPDFYNKYTKAASQIKGKAFRVITILPDLIISVVMDIFVVVKIIHVDPFAMVFVLFPVISTYILGSKMNKVGYELYEENVQHERTKEYVKRSVYLKDYAKEMRLTNVFGVMMNYFNDALKEMISNVHKYGLKLTLLATGRAFFNQVVDWCGSICYAAVRLLYFEDITAGEFVILVNMIWIVSVKVRGLAEQITKVTDNSLYIDNIREFLEYEPKIAQSQDGILPDENEFDLKLSDVSYTYFGQEESVLKNINMEIKGKQKIALVGHNGAGKTTLVKLLMRLYDVSDGQITLNGHNIKEYQVAAYRDLYATVFQDFKLFSLSVAENVMMGEVSEEDRAVVEQALKDSGVYEKVQTLKAQMDSTLTREFDKDGVILSGGESQKIAIARVFAKKSRIAILDEPSSALDPIAEYKMYEAMLRACKDKAVVFISHRLSSAVLADKIYMMENGRIIEAGSHEELMQLNGKYAEMFHMQADNYA